MADELQMSKYEIHGRSTTPKSVLVLLVRCPGRPNFAEASHPPMLSCRDLTETKELSRAHGGIERKSCCQKGDRRSAFGWWFSSLAKSKAKHYTPNSGSASSPLKKKLNTNRSGTVICLCLLLCQEERRKAARCKDTLVLGRGSISSLGR